MHNYLIKKTSTASNGQLLKKNITAEKLSTPKFYEVLSRTETEIGIQMTMKG